MKGRDGSNLYPPGIAEKVRAAGLDRSRTPVVLSEAELRTLGHTKQSAARAIRRMCVDCFGGEGSQAAKADIAGCLSVGCPIWPFRFGRSPYHARGQQ